MRAFFVILLMILGYFGIFSWIAARADKRWPVSSLMFAALVLYLPIMGALWAAGSYLGELGLLLYGIAILYSILYWIWKLWRAFEKRPRLRSGVLVTLAVYTLAVLYIAVFMRRGVSDRRVQMEVFHWMAEKNGDAFRHFLQNTAMFVPVGLMAGLLSDGGSRRGSLAPGVSYGLLLSVCIETIQLAFHMGTCDVDDIIANFLGALAGAAAASLWNRKAR